MQLRFATLAACTIVGAASLAHADLTIGWYTIDAGGGSVSGGNLLSGASFTIQGTIGQPDANASMTGGTYRLSSGFWQNALVTSCRGDVNGDGVTNVADFNILAGHFGAGPGEALNGGDLTDDGFVNVADFNVLAGNFGCTSN